MLKRKFDPRQRYRVAVYLRMSDEKQNPRSPDQQFAEIQRRIKMLGYPWEIVEIYRDDAQSGRYQRRRHDYQRMLADIRSGRVKADLILVDTTERIGRHDELEALRKELRERHGVLILTALTDFADPTTPQGRAYGAFEAMRATEENRNKAHQVLRGKRDLAQQGYWPGGPQPLGFLLRPEVVNQGGREVVAGSKLVPDPETAWIIRKVFEHAYSTGEGQTKVARSLNADPTIPERFKPIQGSSVGYWLDQSLYKGELVWNAHATDIIDDTRRVEPNPEEEILRIPDFCEAIVSAEVWEAVQRVRQARRAAKAASKAAETKGKLIAPLVSGMTLKYPLTGLVRCGLCGASMRPNSSGRKSKGGKSYAYYCCPRSIDGGCENGRYFPEDWLRASVIDHLVRTLFPVARD